jgi:transcriptional regulator with XRE-family HTH domain
LEIFERIKYLRKSILKISQEEFAKKIGLSRSNIGNIEVGRINVTDRVISDIVNQYNVNNDWLINGTEPMFIKTANELVDQIASKYNFSVAEKQALQAYVELSDSDREKISELIQNIFSGFFKLNNEEAATTEDTSKIILIMKLNPIVKNLKPSKKGKYYQLQESQKALKY